jgi:hypothetical protein
MSSKPKSWRDLLPVHPAAELFPLMSEEELRALGEDIRKNGLREGVSLLDGELVDGRNRLDAMEIIGIKLITGNGAPDWVNIPFRNIQGVDPFTFVISKNLHRRHLTADQRRELVERLLKATPDKSNRQVADAVKVDHKTVGAWRAELEGRGEIPHVETRTDRKGRKQAAHKPPTKAAVIAADRAEARAAEQKATPKPEPPPAPQLEAPELAAALEGEAQKDAHIAELEAARDAAPSVSLEALSVEALLDALIAMTKRNPRWINALPLDKIYSKAELDSAISQLQLINKTMAARRGKKAKPKAEALSITLAGLDLSKAGAA